MHLRRKLSGCQDMSNTNVIRTWLLINYCKGLSSRWHWTVKVTQMLGQQDKTMCLSVIVFLMVEQGGIIQISNTNSDTFLTYISIRDCRKFVVNYSKREYWVRVKQKRRQWAKVSWKKMVPVTNTLWVRVPFPSSNL